MQTVNLVYKSLLAVKRLRIVNELFIGHLPSLFAATKEYSREANLCTTFFNRLADVIHITKKNNGYTLQKINLLGTFDSLVF